MFYFIQKTSLNRRKYVLNIHRPIFIWALLVITTMKSYAVEDIDQDRVSNSINIRQTALATEENSDKKNFLSENENDNQSNFTLKIKPFTKIKASGILHIIIEESDQYEFSIETDQKIIDHIQINNDRDTLEISFDLKEKRPHKINSYHINSHITPINNNHQGSLTFIQTSTATYCILGDELYKTDSKTIYDILKIHIKTPNLKSIIANDHVQITYKPNEDINNNTRINFQLCDNSKLIADHIICNKKLQLQCKGSSTAYIKNIKSPKINIYTEEKSYVDIQGTKSSNLVILNRGNSRLKMDHIDSKYIKTKLEKNAKSKIGTIISQNYHINNFGNGKLYIDSLHSNNFGISSNGTSEIHINKGSTVNSDIIIKNSSILRSEGLKISTLKIEGHNTGTANINAEYISNKLINKKFKFTNRTSH